MTDINSIGTGSQTTRPANTPASGGSMDYDAFLKLLIAQLKNQDPSEPMDSAQYMAQLATFSQVEQGMLTNSKLDSLLVASSLEQAESVIGRTITSADGVLSGEVVSVRITNSGPVASLQDGNQILLGPGVVIS